MGRRRGKREWEGEGKGDGEVKGGWRRRKGWREIGKGEVESGMGRERGKDEWEGEEVTVEKKKVVFYWFCNFRVYSGLVFWSRLWYKYKFIDL